MDDHGKRYTVTIYVASAGTPLLISGGNSMAGHMYYTVSDGAEVNSYGFAPAKHGESSGPGKVFKDDVRNYKDPYYSRTMEIDQSQYEKLKEFGRSPAKHNFDMEYGGASNSCIDFTWGALNYAGLHRTTKQGVDKDFEGALKPVGNVDDIKSIHAPMPNSDLNKEHSNPKPPQLFWQKVIGDAQAPGDQRSTGDANATAANQQPRDPLHRQAEEAVRRLEQSLGREYDDNSARLAASSAYLAKENGLTRIDHVVLSESYKSVRQGENVFVVEGALNDPAHKMAHMKTNDAIAQPVEQSLAQLQSLGETQRQQQSQQQEQQRDQSITPPPRMV
ncbi:hypothetical protein CVO74_10590 [Xanthomonas prunicola]|uniref:X-Tfes XVIPCD domain-containing protein n=2 Tax=Xanthomonas prunicola TaxID=2053930 RepID=A0A2N3RL94_9XANT|nr:hypothetical protein XpruCFBP8353_08535 [Xanthomonas prunicola]PKV17552.1 hypothetical protein XpruCFBP8354_08535 [Xanthomonas prunicola]PKV21448.1 hypothetical protein CVO74_10590 [Xanthomonas prunicola]